MRSLLIILLSFTVVSALAQNRISGKVTDARTGEALPFVSVYIKNTTTGTTTDENGAYNIKLSNLPDSLTASFVGYQNQTKAVKKGAAAQVINFDLGLTSVSLNEILIRPEENPAFRIMRQVMAHKKKNDKRKLTAYQYEAYTRMQLQADNLLQKKGRIGLRSAVTSLVDTQLFVTGQNGKKLMPFFISESLSDYFYNRDPRKTKELVKATKVTGIGIQDGTLVSQVIGNIYQDYNFYQNWVSVLRKDFISPIADGWKGSYEYELEDSLLVGENWCYQIKFNQKRAQDLAFNGYLWIDDETFAIRKIDATISKSANINFVEGIHLVQEELPTEAGAWLPVKTRINMKISPLSETRPGIWVDINTSAKKIKVNNPQKSSFFDEAIQIVQKAGTSTDTFWVANRHDTLTAADQRLYTVVDSIKHSPRMARFATIANVLATGYFKVVKISLGPYPYLYANNNIEGHRFQGGFKTNIDFSKKWEFSGYTAYGTLDQRLKYGANVRYIITRKHWSEVGFSRREDLQRVGFMSEKLAASPFLMGFSRFGDLRRPVFTKETSAYLQRDISRGVTQRISIANRVFQPQYNFAFYNKGADNQPVPTKDFTTTELSFLTRYANNEVKVINDNDRISLGNGKWPVVSFKYTLGLNNFLGSTVDYQRVDAGITQSFVMGRLGKANYRLEAGKVFSPVPYPLLEVHLGNQTPFYYVQTFNLMNNFEFASDTYASLHYEQYFEGLLLNSLPLIKKLKWRLLATSNVLYGHLSKENLNLIVPQNPDNLAQDSFKSLNNGPYAEVGYGIENIFRVVRVDAIHRLTYLNDPAVKKFGLRVSFQFKL
ncbi:DUF5686 and carboxypeptidase-like regulatory domain-containing protein [Adhaeribacter rhizoryzae]|uniref:Carboxypeptidase-like regulatory domain-containing protein n=1 Tax=Adhaeribacter rhizoryzae TaxID=2607907 RepID=A0A5M6DGQ4_9BACT|nr:DUF5686 and carboxypeptidase-like regulatory domain-containing protein [Adhaeribacter rhizoryzae]KAA5546718.1 carboxypeptidase-like regulatory domain-containing protein [Adhaeribacter rhizoryzae]